MTNQVVNDPQVKTFFELLDNPKCSDCGSYTRYIGSKFGNEYRHFYFKCPSCQFIDVRKGKKY